VPLVLPHSVFFHFPKTGGIWVREAVVNAGIPAVEANHRTQLNKGFHDTYRNSEFPADKFLFTFVRNPADWYPSYWSYRMLAGWQYSSLDSCMSADFGVFVRRVLRHFPRGYLSRHFEQFCGPPPGVLDFVGRMENLADDLVEALRRAGESFDEAKLRATSRANFSPVRPIYPPGLREKILESERRAVERFGYG